MRDLKIEFRAVPQETEFSGGPQKATITVIRNNDWTCKIHVEGLSKGVKQLDPQGILRLGDGSDLDLSSLVGAFKCLAAALYIPPFRNALPVQAGNPYFDIWIGAQFVSAWRDFKTGDEKEKNEQAYKVMDDIRRIFGFEFFDISPDTSGNTLKIMIDGKSYQLSELGGGLAQFIVVIVNVAMRNPSYILIDEPELGLHPSLQLDFLTTLASYADRGVLFSTHSIGLARSVSDHIYSIAVDEHGARDVRPFETTRHLPEFIGELSYSGYRELGFDKVLLVEGVTDVRTILQFLRAYKKEHQVVMVPLGGSQLISGTCEVELAELKRICDNVVALIDSEKNSPEADLPPARKAFVEVCKKLGINCYVLERRSIENYLSDRAIKQVKSEKYQALKPYERLKESQLPWAKTENWRIAREMTQEEIVITDLGRFLAEL